MITEQYKDKVYFSKLLSSDYPELYQEICDILDANHVKHDTLPLTKDYWCRDYMPIQYACEHFAQFKYSPDYLKGKEKYITDTSKVVGKVCNNNTNINTSSLILDGGNIVVCETNTTGTKETLLVMTDKVMEENPSMSKEDIEWTIRKACAPKDFLSVSDRLSIVWLPWDRKDVCGHTDGILRHVGCDNNGKAIVLANLSVYEDEMADQMRSILKEHFEVRELQLSEYNELSWAYINALQTRNVIIVPGIGNEKLDAEALNQIKNLYSGYKGKIYQVQMRDFIQKWGGALNCCTWTVSEDMSKLPHNIENDDKYRALLEQCKIDEDSIIDDDIRFMGDYYPRRLESVSRRLDNLYFGF